MIPERGSFTTNHKLVLLELSSNLDKTQRQVFVGSPQGSVRFAVLHVQPFFIKTHTGAA
jgi:hypothetical protein